MFRDEYRSAMLKIGAREKFKESLHSSMKASAKVEKTYRFRRLLPILVTLLLMICISNFISPGLKTFIDNKLASRNFKILNYVSSESGCYMAVVYLDGYVYEPSGWYHEFKNNMYKDDFEKLKGRKLGTVRLDLTKVRYTGIPPSLSSTYSVGTEVYTIKGVKKERAVLVVSQGEASVFYRNMKADFNDKKPIDLSLSQVFGMMSDFPVVTNIELLSQQDGSSFRSIDNIGFLTKVNLQLPLKAILRHNQLDKDPEQEPYNPDAGIYVNLVFPDGGKLFMIIYPESECAYVFGGYVQLSDKLAKEFMTLTK